MNIFDYNDYQSYLKDLCLAKGQRSGYKTKLASAIEVQGAYLSRVLARKVNLNLEQAFRLSKFLALTEKERSFLFLLIEKERAGSFELQEYFKKKIETEINNYNKIQTRLSNVKELTDESKAQYYSNWYYLTIHLMAEMDHIKSAEDLSNKLNLNLETVNEVLSFLQKHSLVEYAENRITATDVSVHLPGDSPLVTQHHRNWRLKAMQDVTKTNDDHLHLSAATTIDFETYCKIRKMILKTIEESVKLFKESPIEDVYALNIDWYRM